MSTKNTELLFITPTSISDNSVTYCLGWDDVIRYTWAATTEADRKTISTMGAGFRYHVDTFTDRFGTQHWSSATRLKRPEIPKASKKRSAAERKADEAASTASRKQDFLNKAFKF